MGKYLPCSMYVLLALALHILRAEERLEYFSDTSLHRHDIFSHLAICFNRGWLAVTRGERLFFLHLLAFIEQFFYTIYFSSAEINILVLQSSTCAFLACRKLRASALRWYLTETVEVSSSLFQERFLHCLLEPPFVGVISLFATISTTSRQGPNVDGVYNQIRTSANKWVIVNLIHRV